MNSSTIVNDPFLTQSEADSTDLFSIQDQRDEPSSIQQTTSNLPPCRICYKKASGLHYGANTCEACKGFYRRTMRKFERGSEMPYKCAKEQNCPIEQERIMCSYCRYKRCLDAGMSKLAIKQGRYTHARKAQYTIEIKGMPSSFVKTEPELPIEDAGIDQCRFENVLQQLIAVEEKHDPLFRKQFEKKDLFHERQKEIYIQQRLLSAPDRQTQFDLDNSHQTEELRPIDERDISFKLLTSGFDEVVRYLVDFVKCIPGFRELSLADQSSLLKASFMEFGLMGDCCKFNTELKVIVGILDIPFDRLETLGISPHPDFSKNLLKYSEKVQRAKVTAEEITLLRAILILFTDRCEMEDGEKAAEIQQTLSRHLQHITRNQKGRFALLLGLITDMRNLQLEHLLDVLVSFTRENNSYINNYPIINEVFTTVKRI